MTRTIVVTGSASGIGQAVVHRLLQQGDRVIGIDLRNADVTADLSTRQGRQDAVQQVGEATDAVDALVLCAGVAKNNAAMISVNYFGATEVAEGLRPLLAASGAGRVAVVSSASGTTGAVVNDVVHACLSDDETAALAAVAQVDENLHLYATSKRALTIWTRRTAVAPGWADADITVNAVGPGVVHTPMTADRNDPASLAIRAKVMPMPLRGPMQPESVANLLVWLISAENTHVTGQMVHVDGGVDAVLRGPDVYAGLEVDPLNLLG